MKIARILIISVVALLSIAAGLAKVLQTEQEVAFLQGFGLNTAMIIAFGMLQVAAGVLLVPLTTRMIGAGLAILAFAASTILILMSGNLVFGLLSTIPVVLTGVVVYLTSKTHARE